MPSRRGMTLIELLIAVSLVGVILGALWVTYSVGLKVFSGELSRSGVSDEVSRAFQMMASELRQSTAVTAANSTEMTFTSGVNTSGATSTIQYTWRGDSDAPLNRIVSGVARILITSVTAVAFSYYDANNNLLSTPITLSQVREVEVNVTATRSGASFTLNMKTDLRNL